MENPVNVPTLLVDLETAARGKGFSSDPISSALSIPGFVRPGPGPVVLLSAGIHGDEPASPLAALEFLKAGPSRDFHWLVSPLLNPTGLALGTRENQDGRDLNRDYATLSSAEITAHRAWIDRQPVPDLFIALHEDYDATGFYFYEIQLAGQASIHAELFAHLQDLVPLEPGPLIDGHESNGPGWFFRDSLPDLAEFTAAEGGFPEALYLAQCGCPLSLTLETPTHALPLKSRIAVHLAAIEAALSQFRKI